jgi:hypothetical protein
MVSNLPLFIYFNPAGAEKNIRWQFLNRSVPGTIFAVVVCFFDQQRVDRLMDESCCLANLVIDWKH